MITAVKLKQKFRQRHKSDKTANNKEDAKQIGPEIPQHDLPRPPGRRASDQPRPPGRRRSDVPGGPSRRHRGEPCRFEFTVPHGETEPSLVNADDSDHHSRVHHHKDHRNLLDDTDLIPADDNEDHSRVKKSPRKFQVSKKTAKSQTISSLAKNVRVSKADTGPRRKRVLREETITRRRTDWQARSTRYEVNARLVNIEKSLQDLAIATKDHVYTRLRKIENSLKDMTGRRKKVGSHRKHTGTTNKGSTIFKDNTTNFKRLTVIKSNREFNLRKAQTKWPKKISAMVSGKSHRKLKRREFENDLRHRVRTNLIQVPRKAKRRAKRRPRRVVPDDDLSEEIFLGHSKSPECDFLSEKPKKKLKDMHFCIFEDTSIHIKRSPRLKTNIDTTVEGDVCPPDLRGIVVLDVNDVVVIVVTDWANRSIKSFYSQNNQSCYSQLKLDDSPWGLKKLKHNMVGLTVPKSQQIITFEVNPDLVMLTTINTSKKYWGLAVMSSSTLIAGSSKPACLDVLDMDGDILQSIDNFSTGDGGLENPDCLHVTKNGNILLSDSGQKSVVCMTSSGDVIFTITSAGDKPLLYPSGLISVSSGDVLLADSAANKVMHFRESGTFVKDILGSQIYIEKPFGLCVKDHELYIATRCREVQVFSFLRQSFVM